MHDSWTFNFYFDQIVPTSTLLGLVDVRLTTQEREDNEKNLNDHSTNCHSYCWSVLWSSGFHNFWSRWIWCSLRYSLLTKIVRVFQYFDWRYRSLQDVLKQKRSGRVGFEQLLLSLSYCRWCRCNRQRESGKDIVIHTGKDGWGNN